MVSTRTHSNNCKDKHSNEIRDLKQYEKDLNFKGMDFPVKIKDIKKFGQQNPNLPGINVFSVNHENKIYPLRDSMILTVKIKLICFFTKILIQNR